MADKKTPTDTPETIGNRVRCKMIDGSVRTPTVTGQVWRYHDDVTKSKILMLQQLAFDGGKVELRLGYYLRGKSSKGVSHWRWTRFSPMMPPARLSELYKEAEAAGWLK